MQDKTSSAFWEQKTLAEMSQEEWESLCDGCARCCLHKLEDEDDGQVYYTRVACHLLDIDRCRCSDYANRSKRVESCLKLSVENSHYFNWLPETCAYRLLAEGSPLPDWHPLITGDENSVVEAGISVKHIAIAEKGVKDLRDELISLRFESK